MASVTDKRAFAQASQWGVYGETIEWPPGFVAERRSEGMLTHGETWVVSDQIPQAIQELETKKDELTKGLEQVQQRLDEVKAKVEGLEDRANEDYDDEYGMEDEEDEEDLEQLDNIMQETQSIKTELEEALKDVLIELKSLKEADFKLTWEKRSLPPLLKRLDAPWLTENNITTAAGDAAASATPDPTRETASSSTKKRGKKGKSTAKDTDTQAEDAAAIEAKPPLLYSIKLFESGTVRAADGRRFNFSDAHSDKSAIRSLLLDGEELMKFQWRLILTRGGGDFEAVGILPLVAVCDVTRKHTEFEETYNAAFIYPHCQYATVYDAVKRIAGRKKDYWFKDDLILRNLKAAILGLAFLEYYGVWHGNIKPSNIYVGDDGARLLVGDFLPKTQQKKWFGDLCRNLTNVPEYMSPECHKALVTRKVKNFQWIVKNLDFHKNDVYTLGMTYFFITTRHEPRKFATSEKHMKRGMSYLVESEHNTELVDFLQRMLVFDPRTRPRFWDLLSYAEQAQFTGEKVRSVFQGLFGFGGAPEAPEKAFLASGGRRQGADPVSTKQEESGCAMM